MMAPGGVHGEKGDIRETLNNKEFFKNGDVKTHLADVQVRGGNAGGGLSFIAAMDRVPYRDDLFVMISEVPYKYQPVLVFISSR